MSKTKNRYVVTTTKGILWRIVRAEQNRTNKKNCSGSMPISCFAYTLNLPFDSVGIVSLQKAKFQHVFAELCKATQRHLR